MDREALKYLEDHCKLRHLEREVKWFREFVENSKDKTFFDVYVVDCTAPGDFAYAMKSNFDELNLRICDKELHSRVERKEEPFPLNPAIILDNGINVGNTTTQYVQGLRSIGYRDLFMMYGVASLEGVLYAEAFFKLLDSDFVTEIPHIGAKYRFDSPTSKKKGEGRFEREVIVNGIGLNASLYPAIIYRKPIK
jgi:hypothetical protein|tara:strand:- start:547 stop:1128 length:582 start_codon:yes stop_codon:yes gene_type:complete